MGKKLEKKCPYCGEPISPGHRVDKCKKKWVKTRKADDRLTLPPMYHNKNYEIIPVNIDTFLVTASGSRVAGIFEEGIGDVTAEEYVRNIVDASKVITEKKKELKS